MPGVTQDTLGQLLLALHEAGGTASRAELTDRLGVGRSVMGYLLGELTDRDLVRIDRTGDRTPSGGRPSHRVMVTDHAPTVVAGQISADTFTVGTVSLGGRVLTREEHPLPSTRAPELLDALCAVLTEHVHNGHNVIGVGVAVSSPVRSSDGYAPAALHMGWPGVPVRDMMFDRMPDLPLAVANDANLAGLAEYRHGAGRGATQLLYLTTGNVGLGGATIGGGQVFTGAHGYAIEPGHIAVDPAGAPCPCGSTGCLEVEADHRGLLRVLGRTDVPLPKVTAEIEAVLADPTPQLMAAVRAVNKRLAIGLASLANIVDADRIVLGGTLGRLYALEPDVVRTTLAARAFLTEMAHTPIVVGELADAVLLGAAELAFQPLLDNPRGVVGN
ncbi:ROK family protein [Actinocrispum wychmicini]|uniref:Putative NBD/HSP70 family sugar kinase n=1 Tax=Actinocrispum wychmicini TaxID=1213861 RepID=A0A4R2J600_9PSEU|nr:ROK family protein [Actinocrispum wychmicini]TCO53417.1 putative NBD/HSP70 family sugar kinase [Actinocrispum wychmicini]